MSTLIKTIISTDANTNIKTVTDTDTDTTPSSPTSPPANPVTSSSSISLFIDTITSAFARTALTTAFIIEIDGVQPPYDPSQQISPARRRLHFAQGISSSATQGAELVEAGDFSAIALWEPPTFTGVPFTHVGRSGPLRTEWQQRVEAAKATYLRGRKFYHLSFLARNPDVEPVPGAVRAVIQPFLDRARKQAVPAWLEATYPRAVRLYERFGFKVVEVVTVGEGRVGPDGWPREGGEGVKGYCMVWEP